MPLSPDPSTYTHPLARTRRNVPYGPELHHRLNYYWHSTRATGGNPLLIYVHGGGFSLSDKSSQMELGVPMRYILAYLLDSSYGNAPWDVMTVEFRQYSHAQADVTSAFTNYEPKNASFTDTLAESYPVYGLAIVDDIQRALQWARDYSTRPLPGGTGRRWNGKFVTMGNSAGFTVASLAAFRQSRHYTIPTMMTSPFEATSPSTVNGVLNLFGAIDMSPWYTDFTASIAYLLGVKTSDNTFTRERCERAMLIPDASGLYPSTVSKSPLCKSLSPVDMIAASYGQARDVRIRSIYRANDTSVGNVATYSTTPPYSNPHDPVQATDLDAVCTASGVTHEYEVIANGLQPAWESTLADTMTWLDATVA